MTAFFIVIDIDFIVLGNIIKIQITIYTIPNIDAPFCSAERR